METIKLLNGGSGTSDRIYSGTSINLIDTDDTTQVAGNDIIMQKVFDSEYILLEKAGDVLPIPLAQSIVLAFSDVSTTDEGAILHRYRIRITGKFEFIGSLILWLGQYNVSVDSATGIKQLFPSAPYSGTDSYVSDLLPQNYIFPNTDEMIFTARYGFADVGILGHNFFPKHDREKLTAGQPVIGEFPADGYIPIYAKDDKQWVSYNSSNINEFWIDKFKCEFYEFEAVAKGIEIVLFAPFDGRVEVWRDNREV